MLEREMDIIANLFWAIVLLKLNSSCGSSGGHMITWLHSTMLPIKFILFSLQGLALVLTVISMKAADF